MNDEEIFEYQFNGKTIYPRVLKCDLDQEYVKFAVDTAVESLEKYTVEKDLADYIKRKFDEQLEEFWHVVVGSDFSVSLTHNSRNFVFFIIEKNYFLIFKL